MMHDMGIANMGSNGWVGMTLMMVFWGVLIAVLVFAVLRAVTLSAQPRTPAGPLHDPALTLLRERFARGEITETEYRQAYDVLGKATQS